MSNLNKIDVLLKKSTKGGVSVAVQEWVPKASSTLSISEDEILHRLEELLGSGKVLIDQPTPQRIRSILEYIRIPKYQLELCVLGLLVLGLLITNGISDFVSIIPSMPLPLVKMSIDGIRVLLAVFTMISVPGYFLTTLIFPTEGEIDEIERIALSLGLSLAIIILLGLLLNFTTWGIRSWPFLDLLFCFTSFLFLGSIIVRTNEFSVWERFKLLIDNTMGKDSFSNALYTLRKRVSCISSSLKSVTFTQVFDALRCSPLTQLSISLLIFGIYFIIAYLLEKTFLTLLFPLISIILTFFVIIFPILILFSRFELNMSLKILGVLVVSTLGSFGIPIIVIILVTTGIIPIYSLQASTLISVLFGIELIIMAMFIRNCRRIESQSVGLNEIIPIVDS